jgi:hypothetical protein
MKRKCHVLGISAKPPGAITAATTVITDISDGRLHPAQPKHTKMRGPQTVPAAARVTAAGPGRWGTWQRAIASARGSQGASSVACLSHRARALIGFPARQPSGQPGTGPVRSSVGTASLSNLMPTCHSMRDVTERMSATFRHQEPLSQAIVLRRWRRGVRGADRCRAGCAGR